MTKIDPLPTPRPQILIVDDVPANLGVLRGILEGANLDVLVATSGERALARMAHMQPDLILLDVNMPGIDGYETCRLLKADARWREVPVLFITAQSDPTDKLRGFEAGGVDYLTKPLHAEEVLARVRAHLQIRSLQTALARKNALLEEAMARRLEAEAQLQQGLDRAVLVVDGSGRIEFCTRLARRLLERYFPDQPETEALPSALADQVLGNPSAALWQVEREKSRLEVRKFASSEPCSYLMLMLEEKVPANVSPARLLHLGLTASEAEVLFWAAHGKSNQEVALILGRSINTVKTHVANLIVKMGVDTRLMAALHAAEILELNVVEPDKLRALKESVAENETAG